MYRDAIYIIMTVPAIWTKLKKILDTPPFLKIFQRSTISVYMLKMSIVSLKRMYSCQIWCHLKD